MSQCHSVWKKPGRRKEPGDKEGEEDVEENGELEKNAKVHNSITDQESSRLNSCSRKMFSLLVLIITLIVMLIWS